MIVKTYQINGMHCMGCVSKVEKAFLSHNQIVEADVNLEKSRVKLNMIDLLQLHEIKLILENVGEYEIIEFQDQTNSKEIKQSTYKPLLLVISFILLISLLSSYKTSFHLMSWMTNFMGGFFITFSFLNF